MSDATVGESGTTWTIPLRRNGSALALSAGDVVTVGVRKPSLPDTVFDRVDRITVVAAAMSVGYLTLAGDVDEAGSWWLQPCVNGRYCDWVRWEVGE